MSRPCISGSVTKLRLAKQPAVERDLGAHFPVPHWSAAREACLEVTLHPAYFFGFFSFPLRSIAQPGSCGTGPPTLSTG